MLKIIVSSLFLSIVVKASLLNPAYDLLEKASKELKQAQQEYAVSLLSKEGLLKVELHFSKAQFCFDSIGKLQEILRIKVSMYDVSMATKEEVKQAQKLLDQRIELCLQTTTLD